MSDDQPDEVGSLSQEASRLAAAFTQWAAHNGSGVGQHAHDLAGNVTEGLRDAWHEADAHLATGSAQCTVCPLCRTVAAVREVSPEVKTHLVEAAGSLMAAAAGLFASLTQTAPATGAEQASREDAGVEHIDLDADEPQHDA